MAEEVRVGSGQMAEVRVGSGQMAEVILGIRTPDSTKNASDHNKEQARKWECPFKNSLSYVLGWGGRSAACSACTLHRTSVRMRTKQPEETAGEEEFWGIHILI